MKRSEKNDFVNNMKDEISNSSSIIVAHYSGLSVLETEDLRKEMNNQNLNNYIKSVIDISFLTNKYINDEEPWKLKKNDAQKMNNILHISLEQIAKISILLNPIIPNSTSKVLSALNVKTELRNLSFLNGTNILSDQVKINELDILFKKII